MTIPSRPAPPPPKSVKIQTRQRVETNFNQNQSRYGSTTNWDSSFENNFVDQSTNKQIIQNKKNPPPRPPPPKVGSQPLRKAGQPTSINLLSNLFGKTKMNGVRVPPLSNTTRSATNNQILKLPAPPSSVVSQNTSLELISFDSPPNSPTFTHKSNSDCNSIGSFSSDSNNGRTSQPESGFEDDFSLSKDLWETNDPFSPLPYDPPKSITNQKPVTIGSTSFYSYDSYGSGTVKRFDFDDPLCNGKDLLAPEPMLTKPTIIKPAITKPKPKLYSLISNKGPAPSLPMPNTAVPSPPAGGMYDENEPSYGIALYDFDAIQDGDLSLRENEKVYLHKKLNEEWYFGKNRRGCEGMFPSSYIEVKVPIKELPTIPNEQPLATTSKQTQQSRISARALYNFTAEAPEDLSLQENDIVTDIQQINQEWLYGCIGTRQGQFPANFIEFM